MVVPVSNCFFNPAQRRTSESKTRLEGKSDGGEYNAGGANPEFPFSEINHVGKDRPEQWDGRSIDQTENPREHEHHVNILGREEIKRNVDDYREDKSGDTDCFFA